jgi:hypothetical protein
MTLSYTHITYFDDIHPLYYSFFSFPPLSPFTFPLYIPSGSICTFMILIVSFLFHLNFHKWQNPCDTYLCGSGLFFLEWWSPIPSIFQEMTYFILLNDRVKLNMSYFPYPFIHWLASFIHSLAIVNSAVAYMSLWVFL